MAQATLEQAKAQHHAAVEENRDLGVVGYDTKEKQADVVYEVENGYHHAGGKRLGPGQRFRPTVRQVESGSLRGKARELTRSEGRDLKRPKPARAPGADIGLRALPMAEGTLKLALEAELTEADFEGIEPGFEGRYTRSQIEQIIEAKAKGED